jgi:transposase
VAGLALKAGVNANQLRKWIMLERRRADSRNAEKAADARAPAFVPVVEVVDSGPMRISSRPPTPDALPSAPTRRETIRASQRPPLPSRLLVDLPNGVSLELECTGQDSLLLRTMIDALRAR